MKRHLPFLIITPLLMLGLPFLTVTTVPGDGGMALCFLLFFAVNPLYSAGTGIYSGRAPKTFWFYPLLPPALFLAGVWLLFDMGEPDFLIYAAGYLIIGFAFMAVSYLIRRFKHFDKQ